MKSGGSIGEISSRQGSAERSFREIFRARSSLILKVTLPLVVVLLAVQTSIVRVTKNFYEVDPGRFYRSAQLSPLELSELVQKFNIKTVISLRGGSEDSYWYPAQKSLLEKLGVKFLVLNWTTDYVAKSEDLKAYLKELKSGSYPILVHCRSGADRTSEATAMYALEFMKESKEEVIQKHMSFKYWHIPITHPAKIEMIRRYKGLDPMLANYDACSPEFRDLAEPGSCTSSELNSSR